MAGTLHGSDITWQGHYMAGTLHGNCVQKKLRFVTLVDTEYTCMHTHMYVPLEILLIQLLTLILT